MPERAFAEQVVVVTGASAGVGRATARAFARAGASVGLIARDPQALEETGAELERLGARSIALPCDMADAEAVFATAERVERELGPLDVWVNNAMVTVFSPVWKITPQEFGRVTSVTYLGYVHGTMAALRSMRARDQGTIVQVGSALAYRGIPLQSAYCGAKHAIRGFTDSLRTELLHEGSAVRLTAVHLPAVNTPQFSWARTRMEHEPMPVGTVFQPEAAADAILHAARHAEREYWLGATTDTVILGNMLLPGYVDRKLAATAFDGQSTGQPVRPERRDNLFDPVDGLHDAHGAFNERARPHALLLPGPAVRIAAAAAGLALAAGLGAVAGVLATRRRARLPRESRPSTRALGLSS